MIAPIATKPPLGAWPNMAHPHAHGLVGCWLFNEGAGSVGVDSIRPATRAGFGDYGMLRAQGAHFHGAAFPSTAWAKVPYHSAQRPTAAVTFAIRIRTVQTSFDPIGFAQPIRGSAQTDGGSYGFAMSYVVASNRWQAGVNAGGSDVFAVATAALSPADAWHDLAGVYDGSAMRIYIDGALSASAATSGSLTYNASPSPLMFGAMSYVTGALYYEGEMAHAFLWNRGLSAHEIMRVTRDPYGMFARQRLRGAQAGVSPYYYQRYVARSA